MAGTSIYTSLNGGTFLQINVSYNVYTIFYKDLQYILDEKERHYIQRGF